EAAFPHPWGRALSRGAEGPAGWWACDWWLVAEWIWDKARTAGRGWLACTHSGPGEGPHDGESGPGLLSQVNGRVAGSCGNASAPGTSLLRGCLQLSQDVEGAGQQPPSDGGGGDVLASAPGQFTVGAGEHRVALGRLGGLLQDPAYPGRALLGDVTMADLAVGVAHLGSQPGPGAQ